MQALKHFVLRIFFTLLFLAVPVLGVWSFAKSKDWHIWFPDSVSTYGAEIDRLFWIICWMVAIVFVLTEGALVYFFFRYSRRDSSRAVYTHGHHTLEMVWTAIPAVLLLFVAFSQMGTWAKIKIDMPEDGPYTVERPFMELYGSQFDWRVRYPDRDGNFEGADVIESSYDVYVPEDTKIVFRLRSRDVLHSFFVPAFRIKQDAVPGMEIPVWFEASEVGDYDLVCAELCGWGHYKMAGKVHVLSQADFATWMEDRRTALYANGSED